jgi:hypothetical protein
LALGAATPIPHDTAWTGVSQRMRWLTPVRVADRDLRRAETAAAGRLSVTSGDELTITS